MPRQNAASKAAPAQRGKQAQLDEELAETEHDEALDEFDNATPGVNSTLASPTRIAMGEDSPRRGIAAAAGRVLGYLGLSRKPALEEPQEVQPVEKGEEEVERNETPVREGVILPTPDPSTPTAQQETAKSTALKSPSRALAPPANSAKRKRASDSERQDLYEVPVGAAQQDSEPEEAPTNRPAKRARRHGRAKTPLTIPKTSKGYTSSHQTRHTRGNHAAEAEEVETVAGIPASSLVDGDGVKNLIETEQPKPRKRGRPPKNPPSEAVQDTTTPNETEPVSHAVAKNVATGNRPAIALQAPGDINKGISEILLDPSPIKVVRQEVRLAAPTAKQQNPSRPRHRFATANGMPELSVDEDELEDNDVNAEENALFVPDEMEAEKEDQEETAHASNDPRRTPFDPKLIDRMWETSKHVGHKFDVKEKTWSQGGRGEKLWTGPGKRMMRQLQTLISGYENLQQSKASRDAHEEVEKGFTLLNEETKVVLTQRFRPDSEPKKVKAMLTDLYFNIIPKFIHALKKGVAVYDNQGSMETPALEEILKSVNLLHDLASVAVTQPKEIQPKPDGSVSYQISQPTRYNLPDIRNLQKKILAELRFREREKARAEEELLRPERERQIAEEQEREDAAMRRKREERRRMQGESWWAVRNNYIPSPWNRMLQSDIAKLEAARKGKGRQESVELGYPRMSRAESRCANSEESRHGVERVSVFPGNNVKANSSMSSLSKEDTLVFIDCMRYEQGADRYERAAEQIGRSMDEVFAFAKEFQEAMDLQHQEGNFNEARDSWTYSVWVEQE